MTPVEELRRRILLLASAPRGFETGMISEDSAGRVHHQCAWLKANGLLHKAKLGHRSVIWFASAAAAKAAEDRAHAEKAVRYERAAASKHDLRLRQELPYVQPDHVVVQKCPGFEPRWQGHVGAVAFGLQRGRVTG